MMIMLFLSSLLFCMFANVIGISTFECTSFQSATTPDVCVKITTECSATEANVQMYFKSTPSVILFQQGITSSTPSACTNAVSPCSRLCVTVQNLVIHSEYFYGCPKIDLTCLGRTVSQSLQCTTAGEDCSAQSDCIGCISNTTTSCGWCQINNKCLPGNVSAPFCSSCSAPGRSDCSWSYQQCPVTQQQMNAVQQKVDSLQASLDSAEAALEVAQHRSSGASSGAVAGIAFLCLFLGAAFTAAVYNRNKFARCLNRGKSLEGAWVKMQSSGGVETA